MLQSQHPHHDPSIPPQSFQIVICSRLWCKQMDDDTSIVHQDPPGIRLPLNVRRPDVERLFRSLFDIINHCLGLPRAGDTTDDEIVSYNRNVSNIKQQHILTLLIGDYLNNMPGQLQRIQCYTSLHISITSLAVTPAASQSLNVGSCHSAADIKSPPWCQFKGRL